MRRRYTVPRGFGGRRAPPSTLDHPHLRIGARSRLDEPAVRQLPDEARQKIGGLRVSFHRPRRRVAHQGLDRASTSVNADDLYGRILCGQRFDKGDRLARQAMRGEDLHSEPGLDDPVSRDKNLEESRGGGPFDGMDSCGRPFRPVHRVRGHRLSSCFAPAALGCCLDD